MGDDIRAVAAAQRDIGFMFHVIEESMLLPGGSNGEVSHHGVTKGSAVVRVLDYLGLSQDSSSGIGDSWNDVKMFKECGIGVAMRNATPANQALADETTSGIREVGARKAFRRHKLVTGTLQDR